ncbi:hypothetical protein [Geodermatophilus sp. DSM 45219]|uniref:hypothetical protein n=1 Tax=Geodermatophilus sp. DSM 45219 TaxID=1881103 RepID=UPI000882DDFA|nr:hypothetical protein [Geodermatophilus sp. DSM 45219]SDN78802.1 hypothetical protein SAMN05428965_1626 [Geodermatophilus sp. DSM 45219]
MALYLYGDVVFTSTTRRNNMVTQWTKSASRGGFENVQLDRYGPGLVTYTYTHVGTGHPTLVDGNNYPAFHFCVSHTDPAIIDAAQTEMSNALRTNAVAWGFFGFLDDGPSYNLARRLPDPPAK